jgi:hypothetical protein
MPNQPLGKKRAASSNCNQSNKKIKITIKPKNLKDDDNETGDDAKIKQKTDTVITLKSKRLITYKVSCDGKNKMMKRHVYNYLTSNNGRIRNQNTNLSEFRSLVRDEFNATTDEFFDASENITIDHVDDALQERLQAKSRDQTTRNSFAGEDLEYGKISEKFDSSFGHHVKGIEDRINQLIEERNRCQATDRRREINQEIAILEEDKKVLKDSIRTEPSLRILTT